MICNKCGKQNNDSSKFCAGCGNLLLVTQEPIINSQFSEMNYQQSMNNQSTNSVNNESVINNVIIQQQNSEVSNVQIIDNKKTKSTKSNKKVLFIIGGVVLFVVAFIIILLLLFKNNGVSKQLSNIFDLEQPIPVYKDGGYVYIDTNGKLIKNIVYNEANDFKGNYAYVELQDGTAALIDKNQNVKVSATSYYAMKNITDYNLWLIDGVLYNENLKAITDKTINVKYEDSGFFTYNSYDFTKYGIMNSKGKKIYENQCSIRSLDIDEGANENEYYGIIELRCYENDNEIKKEYLIELQNGSVLYENEYRTQYPSSYYYSLTEDSNNIYYIKDSNYDRVESFYVKDNKIVYSTIENLYDLELYGENHLKLDYGYNYEELGKTQRYYYYDLKNKKLLEEEPEIENLDIDVKVDIDEKERQIVSCKNGKGLIDNKDVIIPCIYESVDYLNNNVYEYMKQTKSMDLLIVESKSGETSIYDANKKKELLKFEQAEKYSIDDYNNSLFMTQKIYVDSSWYSDLKKTVVYNLFSQKSLQFDANSEISIKSNYFTERRDGKKIYYNMNFEKIYTEQ